MHDITMRSSNGGSQGSRNSVSTSASDPREKVKDCCRKLVAFMCTQVGVGGLIVGYAVVGMFGFKYIESARDRPEILRVEQLTNETASLLWDLILVVNVIDRTAWRARANETLVRFQHGIVNASKAGYDGRTDELWSYSAALMFSCSIFTMIGYGNMVPRTAGGKAATVVYAVFGIPLYVLYFRNMGKVLAQTFRWGYTWIYRCSMEDRKAKHDLGAASRVIVPSTACLWVLAAYVAGGTIMFAEWENWSYLDSSYFCVTSLCKIGIGDFVPGASILDARSQTKLVINFVYLLLGMGLIAMCYDLMREDVNVRVRKLKSDIGLCFEDIRLRAVECYQRRNSFDY
ncbi:unnamed protein product [Bemisia tabaci]|uniref:Potassium channel domain-containing protein n=1 Tax=Bemisia tabaci TaxID=7038 RepID=A0A9P0FZR5_BEMTA|nr:unnamed protein product [Bemisia tabaci]